MLPSRFKNDSYDIFWNKNQSLNEPNYALKYRLSVF